MLPQSVEQERLRIEGLIKDAARQLSELQDQCIHATRDKTRMRPTGAFDPWNASYWIDYYCPACAKSWNIMTTDHDLIKEETVKGYYPEW